MAKQGFLIDMARDRLKIPLAEEITSIGRAASNTIRIDSKYCSRKHCLISLIEGTYLLKSRHSRSGIKVNGFYVRERELQTGDEIEIAKRSFIFNLEGLPDVKSSADSPAPLALEKPVEAKPAQPKTEKPKVTYWTLFRTAVRSAVIMVLVLLAGMLVFQLGVSQGWLQLPGRMTINEVWIWLSGGLIAGLGLQLAWGILSLMLRKPGKNKAKVVKMIPKAPKK